jgi:hypothetical protein
MAENERPGGWVEGIGWVARLGDLPAGTTVLIEGDEGIVSGIGGPSDPDPITVVRWADGEIPAPAPSPVDGGAEDGRVGMVQVFTQVCVDGECDDYAEDLADVPGPGEWCSHGTWMTEAEADALGAVSLDGPAPSAAPSPGVERLASRLESLTPDEAAAAPEAPAVRCAECGHVAEWYTHDPSGEDAEDTWEPHEFRPTPAPAPLEEDGRPDTAELRMAARTVKAQMDCGTGDDAAAYMVEAADWIDARPAPASPVPEDPDDA